MLRWEKLKSRPNPLPRIRRAQQEMRLCEKPGEKNREEVRVKGRSALSRYFLQPLVLVECKERTWQGKWPSRQQRQQPQRK